MTCRRELCSKNEQLSCLYSCSSSKATQPRKIDMPSRSAVSSSLQPHGLQPDRLLCPRGFSRQEHWSGLPCPPPGDLPSPGIKPASLMSPAVVSNQGVGQGKGEGGEPRGAPKRPPEAPPGQGCLHLAVGGASLCMPTGRRLHLLESVSLLNSLLPETVTLGRIAGGLNETNVGKALNPR